MEFVDAECSTEVFWKYRYLLWIEGSHIQYPQDQKDQHLIPPFSIVSFQLDFHNSLFFKLVEKNVQKIN